jgi:hypothetical protein
VEANDEPILAFTAGEAVPPGLELRVNFGVFAGRTVTSAEIDRLAEWLLDEVDAVTIISEDRHEIGRAAEASAHQVRIELAAEAVPADPDERRRLEERCLERADYWARTCIADRHADL